MTYRRALANNTLLTSIAVGLLLAGAIVGLQAKNFQWLNRFGSLVICAGVIALARPSIIGQPLLLEVGTEHGKSNDPQTYVLAGDPIPEAVLEDQRSQLAVGVLGPLLCLVGTFVNGFGDLLNKAFGW